MFVVFADDGNTVQERRGRGVNTLVLAVYLLCLHNSSLYPAFPAASLMGRRPVIGSCETCMHAGGNSCVASLQTTENEE